MRSKYLSYIYGKIKSYKIINFFVLHHVNMNAQIMGLPIIKILCIIIHHIFIEQKYSITFYSINLIL